MKINRAFLAVAGLVAGIGFILGALGSSQLPKLRALVLVKIEQISRERLPVRILPSAVDVSFFPLGATLYKTQIIPKEEARDALESATFETVSVAISPWQLMRGRIRLSALEISGAKIVASEPERKRQPGPPLAGLFEVLAQLPINRIALDDVGIRFTLRKPALSLEIDNLELMAEKRRSNTYWIDLNSASVQVFSKSQGSEKASLKIDVQAAATMARNALDVTILKVRRGDSFINATGSMGGDVESLEFKNADIVVKSDLHLESMANWVSRTFRDELGNLPAFKGRAVLEGKFHREGGKAPTAEWTATTSALKINQFLIDRVSANGLFQHNEKQPEIRVPKVSIDHPSGSIALEGLVASLGESKTLQATLLAENVQLQELLKSIGLAKVPVFLQIKGKLPCDGRFTPDLFISCKGQAHGENLLVRSSLESRGTIAALRVFDADGEVTIDKEKVAYNAELAMPASKGRSSGVINYETGFRIAYEADKLSLKDIANVADLKIEGSARIKGTTQGNADTASLALDADGSDIWLEDFWLGNVKGPVAYKNSLLTFSNMQGYYTVSRYNGDVGLDLHKKEISITGRAPFFDVRDVLRVFSRKVKLPFQATGTGQAQIRASGPLALNRMSYDLKTSVFKGSVANETFEQAFFDVKSVNGEVSAQRVQINKGASVITLTGQGHPDGSINTVVQGRGMKLEDSIIVSGMGITVSGVVDFDMDMAGPVLSPNTELRGHLTKTSIGDQAMPDSNFKMKFGSKTLEGDGTFLGNVLNASFIVPFETNAPFALKVKTSDWNYAPIFAAIASPGARKDYEGRLTSSIDLSAATGGFWNSSGNISIEKFSLSRGSLALRSAEPLSIKMKGGQVTVEKFDLVGDNTFLRATNSDKPQSKLDLQVNGKVDMTLLGLLTPFFEDLRGILSFTFNWRAEPTTNEILGSAYVEKGFLKFFDFPHPIEDVRIDLLFNHKKILVNSVKAEFGGGRVSGSGGIDLKGPKNYPVSLAGQFEKVTVNVPDKIRSSGSGNLSFSGSWFPFLLKVDYDVRDGLMTKDFGGDTAESGAIRRDQFLPEFLVQERFIPILIDLDVNFSKGIQVKNEVVDGRMAGTLSVKGNPSKPSILGQVNMEKETKISVKDTLFEVTSSNIQFTDPNEINPKLYIAARARVQEYDISLLVQGTGSKPEYAFTSVPALAEKDIISLLALGTTETQTNPGVTANPTSQQNGPHISTSTPLKNNPLSQEIKERTGFDLQFAPGFDETTAVQKIIISRQFTNKLGVSASQALGNRRATDAEVRYRLNERVSGILSWQNRDNLETVDKTAKEKEQNKFGLDLEYKFEFK